MGPQHPSTHGVLRLVLKLEGETVLGLTPVLGYVHRGIEKMGEAMTVLQFTHLTDRLDYLSAHMNNWGWALAVEQALGIEVPERAEHIRVIMSELTRISSHQLWWGVLGMDLGAFTPFLYGFRDRELINDIFEKTCGARLTMNYIRPGGVTADVDEDFAKDVRAFVDYFTPVIDEYETLVGGNIIFQERTKGIGVLSADLARSLGCTGPTLRASGVSYDVRRNRPYGIYPKLAFNVPVVTEGDSWARYKVRIAEMRESLAIIRQALDTMPEGPVRAKLPADRQGAGGPLARARRGRPRRDRLLPGRRRHRQAVAASRCAARTSRTWRRCPRSSRAAGWPTWWPCSRRWTSSSPASTDDHDRQLDLAHRDASRRPSRPGSPACSASGLLVDLAKMAIVAAILAGFVVGLALALVWIERKVAAHVQQRLGPMRVGPHGLLQTLADGLKLLSKENITPLEADHFVFHLAPLLCFAATFVALAFIPFAPDIQAVNFNVGLVFVLGIGSVGVLGILAAGWSSNNKWSLLGAMRAGAQIISYELSATIALLSILVFAGSLDFRGIVASQARRLVDLARARWSGSWPS